MAQREPAVGGLRAEGEQKVSAREICSVWPVAEDKEGETRGARAGGGAVG